MILLRRVVAASVISLQYYAMPCHARCCAMALCQDTLMLLLFFITPYLSFTSLVTLDCHAYFFMPLPSILITHRRTPAQYEGVQQYGIRMGRQEQQITGEEWHQHMASEENKVTGSYVASRRRIFPSIILSPRLLFFFFSPPRFELLDLMPPHGHQIMRAAIEYSGAVCYRCCCAPRRRHACCAGHVLFEPCRRRVRIRHCCAV